MEPQDRNDPLARQRARERRARQVQRRRVVAVAALLVLIILIVVLAVTLSRGGPASTVTTVKPSGTTSSETGGGTTSTEKLTSASFSAELTGDQSVPPVTTKAKGLLTVKYDAERGTLTYVLEVVSMITNPSTATIFEGTAGAPGAAVVTLFPGPTEIGEFKGVLAEGFIEDDDLIGSLRGQTVQDLVALLKSGNAYVSIGNKSHPVDAIRGQIK